MKKELPQKASPKASPQEVMTARLFFNAAFPTMQVLLDDDYKITKAFQDYSGVVQFGALKDGRFTDITYYGDTASRLRSQPAAK